MTCLLKLDRVSVKDAQQRGGIAPRTVIWRSVTSAWIQPFTVLTPLILSALSLWARYIAYTKYQVYVTVQDELIVAGVFVRVYNEQPDFAFSPDEATSFCKGLVTWISVCSRTETFCARQSRFQRKFIDDRCVSSKLSFPHAETFGTTRRERDVGSHGRRSHGGWGATMVSYPESMPYLSLKD